jgi:hypothetical protein
MLAEMAAVAASAALMVPVRFLRVAFFRRFDFWSPTWITVTWRWLTRWLTPAFCLRFFRRLAMFLLREKIYHELRSTLPQIARSVGGETFS